MGRSAAEGADGHGERMQMLCVQDRMTALLFLYTRLVERSEPATGPKTARQPRDTRWRAAQRHFSTLPLAMLDGETRHSRCCAPFQGDFTIRSLWKCNRLLAPRQGVYVRLLSHRTFQEASKQSKAIRTPRPCSVAERSWALVLFGNIGQRRHRGRMGQMFMFGLSWRGKSMPSREQEVPDKTKNVDVGPVASRAKTGCVDVQGGCWSWSASDLDFNGSPTSPALHVLHGWMCSPGTDVGEEKSVSIAPIDIAWCVLGGQFSHQDQILGGGGVLCLNLKMFVEQSRRCRVVSFGPRIFRHFLLLRSGPAGLLPNRQFLDSRVVCAYTPVSRQQFSLASEIIEGNYSRPPPTTAPNSPPRRPPCAAPPPSEAELFERTQANLRPPFPKLRLRDRRNATPSPSSGPHNHKRSWITDATPAHGSFSMILAVPSPWGYAPALLTSDLATSSQR